MTFAFIGLAIVALAVVFLLVVVNYDTNEEVKKRRFDAAAKGTTPLLSLVPPSQAKAAQGESERPNLAGIPRGGKSAGANFAAGGG